MRVTSVPIAAALLLAASPQAAAAQAGSGGLDTYYRAVGEYFGVGVSEVRILAEWRLPPGEIPVVLLVARRGGVSPDAVVALRRSGRAWADLASRYGVHAGQLHVGLSEGAALGPLERAYGEYESKPSSSWPGIRLDDAEFVALVNLRFLSDHLGRPAGPVLQALIRGGAPPEAYRLLVRGG